MAGGCFDQSLAYHSRTGRLERGHRGLYRFRAFPPADHEDLVTAWLWSDQRGTISHESAFLLHDLSDALPANIHITLPLAERGRVRRVPAGILLHHGDIADNEKTWIGPVPVTREARSIRDVAADHGDPRLIEQAIEQGIERRRFRIHEVASAVAYIAGDPLPPSRMDRPVPRRHMPPG